ncbi:hypothetical protein XELAEV_18042001mg [Xenopus laevis]|uniref:Uncharacterized protein n=1 Tax=Xenopus laevis TaxID=8355 RepID=A0A974C371_XENLA|nr:hypothetical protein XELAEV_18042001mg [Xenopus laevis]
MAQIDVTLMYGNMLGIVQKHIKAVSSSVQCIWGPQYCSKKATKPNNVLCRQENSATVSRAHFPSGLGSNKRSMLWPLYVRSPSSLFVDARNRIV